jgi:hypothetical protein
MKHKTTHDRLTSANRPTPPKQRDICERHWLFIIGGSVDRIHKTMRPEFPYITIDPAMYYQTDAEVHLVRWDMVTELDPDDKDNVAALAVGESHNVPGGCSYVRIR